MERKKTSNNCRFDTKKLIWVLYLLVTLSCLFFILFHNLGNNAIADWDEARHGINAYEMIHNKNWIVSTYQYKPDLWNLKPPISYYCISLAYLIFGYSVFSLRVYSAVSIIAVYLISMVFLHKHVGKAAVVFLV